jgi:hypothetical protein
MWNGDVKGKSIDCGVLLLPAKFCRGAEQKIYLRQEVA